MLTQGCTNPPSRIAYNSIATVAQGAQSAYDSYTQLVILGQIPTNDFPKISKQYDLLQTAVGLAIQVARQDTNAVAPPSLNVQYNSLLAEIAASKAKK